jgi:hypothetical protein
VFSQYHRSRLDETRLEAFFARQPSWFSSLEALIAYLRTTA